MFEERSLKLDIVALVLLAGAVFLTVSLATYDPADPPGTLVYPVQSETTNACGRLGAWTATGIYNGLGLGAYYLVVSIVVLDVLLLMRHEISGPSLRAVGWIVSLVALTVLAAMTLQAFSPGPVIGSGGYLGAAGRGLLESHFASAGSYILLSCMLLGGLLLCTDYIVLKIAMWVFGTPAAAAIRVGQGAASRAADRRKKVRDKVVHESEDEEQEWEEEEEEDEEDEAEREVSVKFVGRDEDDDEEDSEEVGKDEEEDDEEEESVLEEEDEQPEGEKSGIRKKIAAALKIRKPAARKKQTDREDIQKQLDDASSQEEDVQYDLPSVDLLLESENIHFEEHEKSVRRTAKILEKTFFNFGFKVRVVEIQSGPVIAQYELELDRGLRLAKIANLSDDIAIALRVPSVRIVAPIPGKNTVGIEVPNRERQMVRMREIIEDSTAKIRKMKIPIFLGKDVSGGSMVIDLATLPHLLIAGRTGTGKSVCLNSIIISMLMTRRPDEVKLLLIDPKMVELSPYQRLPHLMHPVVTDMKKAEAILAWAVDKMEERYSLLARAGVRHVSVYNQLGEEELMRRLAPESDEERDRIPNHLPYIVIVADEMADLMMTAGKDVEQHIIRLAQKSRAVGIHLVLATQKPTVDVITGLIKSNLPARISFQVSSRTDSRVVLDEMGADRLLGNGDMLFLWPGTSSLLRGQGTYVSDDEISAIINEVSTNEPQFVTELVQLKTKDGDDKEPGKLKNRDELYEAAVDVVVRERRGSVSLLQRSLGVGYGRGARLIDYMAEDGIVGPYNGSQAREVLVTLEQWATMNGYEPEPEPPKPRNTIRPEKYTDSSESDSQTEAGSTASRSSATASISNLMPSDSPPWEDDYEEDEYEAEDEELEDEIADDEEESGDEAAEYEEEEDEYEEEDEVAQDEEESDENDELEDESDEYEEEDEEEYEEEADDEADTDEEVDDDSEEEEEDLDAA